MKNNHARDAILVGVLTGIGVLVGWAVRGRAEKKHLKKNIQLLKIKGFNSNLELDNRQKRELQNDTFRTCIL